MLLPLRWMFYGGAVSEFLCGAYPGQGTFALAATGTITAARFLGSPTSARAAVGTATAASPMRGTSTEADAVVSSLTEAERVV